MAKITFEVDNKQLNIVLTILKNLKMGLIKNLKVEEKPVVQNEEKASSSICTNSRYISKEEFKARLKKQR
ncbi:hypothetical protein [Arcobacter sp. CECT 8985]|uniref:hypothetical protein n=1 Tax=Arcobacter sp. CECT 8985 TaxID=1935424 RepID=UPI00100A37F2|nr:hypothetical protein [Arcobacter sp. CECT 8985]RXJ87282.1 hypothetical protein CRU93_05070 [Arcobacter sp. CECT 8985]